MRKLIVCMLVCMLLFSTACGTKKIITSTMELKSDGSINTYILTPFDTTKFNEVDLKNWVTLEIGNYNTGKDEQVILQELYVSQGEVLLSMIYPSYNDYIEFNGEVLFFDTVEEAMGLQFYLTGEYLDADGSKATISDDLLVENPNWKVLIAEEDIRAKTYTNASFYSSNVKQIENRTYDFLGTKEESNDEEYFILIFE